MDITQGLVLQYCDNKSATGNIFEESPRRGIFPMLEHDYDLLQVGRGILRELPIDVPGLWVKGHYIGKRQ